MAVLGAVWLYGLLRKVVREDLALLGSLIAATVAPALTTSQSVTSESAACFATIGALYYGLRLAETEKTRFAVLAGMLVAFAGLLRVAPAAGLVPAICLLLYPVRNGWRKMALVLGVMIACLSLPVLWFGIRSRDPRLTNSTGYHLFNRVVWEQKLLGDGPATQRLRALIGPQDPRELHAWEVHFPSGAIGAEEIEPLFAAVALEGIRANPGKFLAFTTVLAWKLLVADQTGWIPQWGDTAAISPRLENPPPLAVTTSSFVWRRSLEILNRLVWPILCWLAVAGLLLGIMSPQRLLIVSLALVPIGHLVFTAGAEMFAGRYYVPVIPFIVGLAMIPLDLIWTKLREGTRGRFQVFETEAISDAVR